MEEQLARIDPEEPAKLTNREILNMNEKKKSIENLQILLYNINKESKQIRLTINKSQIKYVVISKNKIDNIQLILVFKQVERVHKYN